MKIKGIITEDFVNYKKISMTIMMPICKNFKCDKECGRQVCQNSELASVQEIEINDSEIINMYLNNPLTEAVVFQGLEPFDSWEDLTRFIDSLRTYTHDDIVIYTGYTKKELEQKEYLNFLKKYDKIIIKYGRYIPDQPHRFDKVLGV